MLQPDPIACALFLIAAFVIAGVAQTAWFGSPASRRFAIPLDAGLTLCGRRIFGDHKTLRGFVVMVPATAVAFAGLALAAGGPERAGLWPLTAWQYAGLGALAALGFMLGELPNSLAKRQLGIDPGGASTSRAGRIVQFVADRLDSPVAMLATVSFVVAVPALTWVLAILIGPVLHWVFSLLMFVLGLKARPA
jgi:CDP-2,3-bis-(O-geranylgeranyl)-sn-glycerol synthase